MKIIDSTTYFEEDMMIDLRLNILNEYVDKFVIVENTYMHSGKKKDLVFNIKNFSKFEDKILNNLKKGNLELDELKQLCFWKNQIIELTVAEFNLIKSLAKYPGVVKDRNQLMDAMYGDSIYVDDRTIDSHIKRLRKKFKTFDSSFDQIRTRYGSGYSWRE